MAVSAFRSTSRRGEEEGKKRGSNRGRAEDKPALPTRRSRSVSAAIPRSRSGRGTTTTDNASAPPISSSSANHLLHFDNPLFASHHTPTRTPPPTNTTNNTTLAPETFGRNVAFNLLLSTSTAPRKRASYGHDQLKITAISRIGFEPISALSGYFPVSRSRSHPPYLPNDCLPIIATFLFWNIRY